MLLCPFVRLFVFNYGINNGKFTLKTIKYIISIYYVTIHDSLMYKNELKII